VIQVYADECTPNVDWALRPMTSLNIGRISRKSQRVTESCRTFL